MIAWKSYKLSDVANLTTGFPFDGHKYAKDGVRVVRGDNVTIGSLRWDADKDKRWNEPFSRACEYTLYDGDIVIGMDGSRVGKNRAQIYKSDLPLLLAQRVACIRHNEKSYQEFLYYQIFSERFVEYIKSVQTGTSIPHVSLKQIGDYPIQLPPIEEQIRIAKILRSLDDKIALNNRINHNLEEQAQALYKSWFVDFEPFKDGKFIDSELGMIPDGWRIGTLSELGDIIAGGTPSKAKADYYTSSGIHWLTPKDLSNHCGKFTAKGETDITPLGYKNSSAKLMPRGTVLFSSRAPIGYITIAKNDICTNQGFKSVVPTNAGTGYIYYWLKEHTSDIEAQASGSTFKEASGALMKSFSALIPPKEIIDSFEEKIRPLLGAQEKLEEEVEALSQARDLLLPSLMSGTLEINNLTC